MGMSEINVWVLIRRYDKFDAGSDSFETNLQCFSVLPGLTLDELKQYVHFWIGIQNDGTKVLKIRQHDKNLIPISELLQGSQKEKPFIIDVVGVHQFCPVEKPKVPPGYVDALKAKLNHLEKRVMMAETHVPNMIPIHVHSVEMTALKLANCVSFLDRRLDELAPKQWKTQMEPDVDNKD